jgi:bla regulator protein blaR1
MISNALLSFWDAVAPALGNHLWQSTLFAVAAAVLTLILRKNQARARYWLWMAASIKFLIPFSWLVAIGSRLAWLLSPAEAKPPLYFTLEAVSQPFTQSTASVIPAASNASPAIVHWIPTIFAAMWLCGFLAVVLVWWLRWRKISADIRSAVPLREGREVEALRRAEHVTGIRQQVQLLLSRATLEPGIFGMARPILVWPHGISDHLDAPHLEAIIAHELWHVRRRDNLAAALHMIVEALFWFHPLVWWVGSRLIDERERACDEQVLEAGSERQVYAESILKVCEFCVGSPLACVSGVTGADLKKRMVHIMTEHVVRKLDFSRKLVLSTAGVLALALPLVYGLLNATPGRAQSQDTASSQSVPASDSFSIKPTQGSTQTPTYAGSETHMVKMMYGPDGFIAGNITLKAIIQEAYGVQANQIFGGPEWLDSATYDITAKPDQPDKAKGGMPNPSEDRRMLQVMLADRLKLKFRRETKELPSFALEVVDGGSKLQPAQPAGTYANEVRSPDGRILNTSARMQLDGGQVVGIEARRMSTADLAAQLSRQLGSAVVDKTRLKGTFDFNLHWTAVASGNSNAADSPLFTAIEQQLGLKLEPQNAPMEVLVIDHIEKPAED